MNAKLSLGDPTQNPVWHFDNHVVGVDDTVLVIAEIGMNHNGSVALARELIDAAATAGAHVAKFQMRHLPTLYGSNGDSVLDIGAQYVRDVVTKFELSVDDVFGLMEYTKSIGLSALCTPFDSTSLTTLIDHQVSGIKLASADLVNHRMIRDAVASGLPVLLSTGMSAEGEIVGSIRVIRSFALPNQVALLHCNSAYPAPTSDLNLRYIPRLQALSDMVVGYSGHERGVVPAVVAVACGARIIEKHITLDHEMEGPDHRASLLPSDFADLCSAIAQATPSLGSDGPRVLSQGERMNRLALGKSLVATRDIDTGETLAEDMITATSPGVGLPPYRIGDLVGHTTHRFISAGEAFVHEDFVGWGPTHVDFSFRRPWGIPVRFRDYVQLLERMWPDFLEFHLGRDDLDFEFDGTAPDLSGFALKVHSPDVFANDHLLDLANVDPHYAAVSVRSLQRVIDQTRSWAHLFAPEPLPVVIASVGGFSPDVRMSPDERSSAYDRLAANLALLDLDGVELSMQTLPPFPWYFGGQLHCNLFVDPTSTREFAERVSTGICLDVSHTQMSATYLGIDLIDAVADLLPVVNHLHLSDATGVSGEGVQIGEGEIDFARLAALLNDRAPDVSFIPEIWQGHLSRGAGFVEGLRRLEILLT